MDQWSFLTNHGLVLVCVARGHDVRLRSIAECVGITDRTAHKIVCELEEAGYLTRHRDGRRNTYQVHPDAGLRHPLEQGGSLGALLGVFVAAPANEAARPHQVPDDPVLQNWLPPANDAKHVCPTNS